MTVMTDMMVGEEVKQLPQAGSFGSMSREQLLAMAQHPPRAVASIDPTANARKLSEVSSMIGRKALHTKKNITVQIQAQVSEGKYRVQASGGAIFVANESNLRFE